MQNGLDRDQCQNCARVIGGGDPNAIVEGGFIVACGSCKPSEQPTHYYHENCCCLKCHEVRKHRNTPLFNGPKLEAVENWICLPSGVFYHEETGRYESEIPF